MPRNISTKMVTARWDRLCMTCGAIAVRKGDAYVRNLYAHDGRLYNWVQCRECESILSDVYEWAFSPEDGVGQEEYIEWAHDHRYNERLGGVARAYLRRCGLDMCDSDLCNGRWRHPHSASCSIACPCGEGTWTA